MICSQRHADVRIMMNTADDQNLVAHVRRLASDGVRLYVRIDGTDVARLHLTHGQRVEIDMGGKVCVRGIVKTSGGSPWLAPGQNSSNAAITSALRNAGLEHGDDIHAVIRCLEPTESPVVGASATVGTAPSTAPPIIQPGGLRLNRQTAINAVRDYNADYYKGRRNVDLDRDGYQRFRAGLPDDELMLIDMVRFVGEDYGGAQRRFLPHGYRDEAALIVAKLRPVLDEWRTAVAVVRPLAEEPPDKATLVFLFSPFRGTKCWPVWASKTLHFLRPDAFPIFDSRAKKALGMATLGSTPADYHRFCCAFRDALVANRDALAAARDIDGGESPSDVKLLDKILFQRGG